jgi:hypothetical protein
MDSAMLPPRKTLKDFMAETQQPCSCPRCCPEQPVKKEK